VALLALLRPVDSVLVVAPVLAIALLVPRLRRLTVLGALVTGGVLGWLPWIAEAFVRFGDPWSRLTAAEQDGPKGLDPDLELMAVLPRLLDGIPAYYTRDLGMDAGPIPAVLTAWLITGLVLVPAGLVAARVQRRSAELAVAVVPAAVLAAFYLLLPAFTALRFLLPVVALLALPVGVALVHAVEAVSGRARAVAAALVAVGVVGHVAIGVVKAGNSLEDHAAGRTIDLDAAAAVRPLVEREQCLLVGQRPQVIAFYVGCAVQGVGPEPRPPAAVDAALGRGWDVLAVMDAPPPPGSYLASWHREELPGLPRRIRVLLPPEE
jgi:hypothetical protein